MFPNLKEVQDSSCRGTGGVPIFLKSPKTRGFRGVIKKIRRGMEQWKLVGLITRRPLVRIQLPLPMTLESRTMTVGFVLLFYLCSLAGLLCSKHYDIICRDLDIPFPG